MTEPLLPLQGGLIGPDSARLALDRLYRHVHQIILNRQHPVTGLLPASTAVTVHGNYTHAWVRDNVYSVLAPWALALAYRRRGDGAARARRLEQCVVKTMRGILQAMMRQAAKVERFKHTQAPLDSLHAIYSASTGEAVTPDDGWGHLQVDATSLFLLVLAQMTRSGLTVLFTQDEVAFVQNLVHYIGPAYRIADYGIWERGRKINDGAVELNASSVGMAKAALEAIQGLDMFGEDAFTPGGSRTAVIQVVPDEIARARATLEALLPRESGSKEIDAALLSIIGFPAFAVEDPEIVRRTGAEIQTKLEGRYGCKRFLRDGHQTALEDHTRLHYEAGELRLFDGIESEWPLFFTYKYVTALMLGDHETASAYRVKLDALLVEVNGEPLLPELFYVGAAHAEAERAAPGSQPRRPNENLPLLWAQSLYIVGLLLEANLLSPADVDPLNRRGRIGLKPTVPLQLVVLAEEESVRQRLRGQGVEAQTLAQVAPVRVCHADVLNTVLAQVGACPALGLTGRPKRRLGSLITAQAFRLSGQPTVFVPSFFDPDDFYFSFDNRFVVERLLAEIAYVNRAWNWGEPPLLVLLVTRGMSEAAGFEALAGTLADLVAGRRPDLAVEGGTLGRCLVTARTVTLDGVPPGEPIRPRGLVSTVCGLAIRATAPAPAPEEVAAWATADTADLLRHLGDETGLERRLELLALLAVRLGLDFTLAGGAPLRDLVEELYRAAGRAGCWTAVRRAAALLDRHDDRLQDAIKEMVVRQKRVLLGHGTLAEPAVQQPLDNEGVIQRLRRWGGDDARLTMLAEEMVLFCGTLLKAEPDLFRHCRTFRPVELLGLLARSICREAGDAELDETASVATLMREGPHAILSRLRRLIAGCPGMGDDFCLPILKDIAASGPVFDLPALDGSGRNWSAWRDLSGTLLPLPEDFYARVWEVLRHCEELVIADPSVPDHRLDSHLLRADRTPEERDFAHEVEARLDRIVNSGYRSLTVEALWTIAEMVRARPEVRLPGALATDHILAAAVHRHWRNTHSDGDVNEAGAWRNFYSLSPIQVAEVIGRVFLEEAAVCPTVASAA